MQFPSPQKQMMRAAHLIMVASLWLFVAGCDSGSEEANGPLDLAEPWQTAEPARMAANTAGLDTAVQIASARPRAQSLLVVRGGRLIVESYFNDNVADNLNDVRSVTKSILGILTGIAIEEGFINSLDDTLDEYLVTELELRDPALKTITIRHLLTMTSGLAWDERTGPSYSEWIQSKDRIAHVLDLPRVNPPGQTFTYNSGTVHLLGVVLQKATGMRLTQFADQFLFQPIGIKVRDWEAFGQEYVNGGAGIDLRPRDLARIGQLFLQNGMSGSEQVVPADWIAESTKLQVPIGFSFGALKNISYGYLWWVEDGQPEPAYYAWGYGGQFIYIAPALDAVVVFTTRWRELSLEGGPLPQEEAALDIIINHVLPALRQP